MSEKINELEDKLLNLALGGEENATNTLIDKYRGMVEATAMKYINSPLEKEDLFQEGMIGFIASIYSYKSDKGASFKTYAHTCVENSIQSALRKFNRKKDVPSDNVVPYEEEYFPDSQSISSAEDSFLAQESVSLLTQLLEENLSDYENEVLRLYIIGCSYSEIAERLNKTPKATDNAIQRIRTKLKKFKTLSDTNNFTGG